MNSNQTSFNQLYQEVEPILMPIIRSCAERFHRSLGIQLNDAIQEGRIALLTALRSYDYNRSHGGIYSFARRSVERAMLGLLYQATARGRLPAIPVHDEATGQLKLVRRWPTLLEPGVIENYHNEQDTTPERASEEAEMIERLHVLKMRMINRLSDREQMVFSCLSHPSDEFTTFLRNVGAEEATNVEIAKFLGLSKNSVDWSIHKIKREFTSLAEAEFSDVIQKAVLEGKWPMLYVSHIENDAEHIKGVLERRGLDPRPVGQRDAVQNGPAVRIVETYAWGVVLFLRLGERTATVVCEGRFNQLTGEVIGAAGYWKSVVDELPWYVELNRVLKRGAKQ